MKKENKHTSLNTVKITLLYCGFLTSLWEIKWHSDRTELTCKKFNVVRNIYNSLPENLYTLQEEKKDFIAEYLNEFLHFSLLYVWQQSFQRIILVTVWTSMQRVILFINGYFLWYSHENNNIKLFCIFKHTFFFSFPDSILTYFYFNSYSCTQVVISTQMILDAG